MPFQLPFSCLLPNFQMLGLCGDMLNYFFDYAKLAEKRCLMLYIFRGNLKIPAGCRVKMPTTMVKVLTVAEWPYFSRESVYKLH